MNTLPFHWADWSYFETRLQGFIQWAEPAPSSPSEERYAVVNNNGIRWARVSPNSEVRPEMSSGCFYSDMAPGGAIEAASLTAAKHKAKIRAIVEGL